MKQTQSIINLSLVLVCLLGQHLAAHQLNAAETTVKYNKRTHSIEFVHSFYLHDVIHLIQKTRPEDDRKPGDRYGLFSEYILKNLKMNIDAKSKFDIKLVGTESKTQKFYIYQEIEKLNPKDIAKMSFDIDSMRTLWTPKYWLFNIEFSDTTRSFVLDQENTEKVVTF